MSAPTGMAFSGGPRIGVDRRVVMYSSSECWRGAGISYVNIARGLVRHGYQVRLVALEGAVAAEFRAEALEATMLPRARGEAWRLRKFLKRFGADVLVVDRAHDLRVGTLASVGTRARLINRYNLWRPSPPTDLVTRLAYYGPVRELVFLSESARARVLAEAPFMGRVPASTIHEGVEVDEFRPNSAAAADFRWQFKLGAQQFLLAVGALSWEKRYAFLLDCLARLGERAPLLVVCGEGPDEADLRARAARLRLDVRFLGRLPRHTLVGAYNAACALIHAGCVETFGLAVLEAMACARPVIAAASGALPEVLGASAECGRLVPPESMPGFVDAIASLESDPEGWRDRSLRARQRAVSCFSVQQMEDAYARVVARHFRS